MRKSNRFQAVFFVALLLLAITPLAAPAADHATVTTTNTPTCMKPGETKTVSVSVLNDGDTMWTAGTYRLSYHWEGPMNIWDGIRTDITGTVLKGASQVVNAQLKAADHNTAANLPVGTYTLKWQMIHTGTGWIPVEKPYTVTVKESCGKLSLSELCKTINCLAKEINRDPRITSVGTPPFSQGQYIFVSGKNFGDSKGSAMLTGTFGTAGSPDATIKIVALTKRTITLPVQEGWWTDTGIVAGPIPSNLIGYDQDADIQVKTSSGAVSKEKKVPFKTLLDYQLLPRSAMTATCWAPGCMAGSKLSDFKWNYCNDYPNAYVTNSAAGYHEHSHSDPHMGTDFWQAALKKGWKFHDMQGGSWDGPIIDPRPSLVESGNSISFKVDFTIPGNAGNCYDVPSCWNDVGYWLNIIVAGPLGMPY